MERRTSLRGRTDVAVTTLVGRKRRKVRAVELSGNGIVLDQRRANQDGHHPLFMKLFIQLPERQRSIFAIARPVRSYGTQQALRFVEISDADRLNLAEHLDVLHRRGTRLS